MISFNIGQLINASTSSMAEIPNLLGEPQVTAERNPDEFLELFPRQEGFSASMMCMSASTVNVAQSLKKASVEGTSRNFYKAFQEVSGSLESHLSVLQSNSAATVEMYQSNRQDYQSAITATIQSILQGLPRGFVSDVSDILLNEHSENLLKIFDQEIPITHLESLLEGHFEKQLEEIDTRCSQALRSYENVSISNLREVANKKSLIYDQYKRNFLENTRLLQAYLEKVHKIFPKKSLYGKAESQLRRIQDKLRDQQSFLCNEMQERLSSIAPQLESVVSKAKSEIREARTKQIQLLIGFVKEKCEQLVKKGQSDPTALYELKADVLAETTKFYKKVCIDYIDTVEASLNIMARQNADMFFKTLVFQEKLSLFLSNQSSLIFCFLQDETKRLLRLAQECQEPMRNKSVEFSDKGDHFDDMDLFKLHGPISRVKIRSGWIVDAMQFCYGERWGHPHGGTLGDLHTFSLREEEKINRVVINLAPYVAGNSRLDKVVNSITMFTNKQSVFGPYGGSENGGRVNETITADFGPDYYLASMEGYESPQGNYIAFLQMQFLKDFSSLIDSDDIEQKIEALSRKAEEEKPSLKDLEKLTALPQDISEMIPYDHSYLRRMNVENTEAKNL